MSKDPGKDRPARWRRYEIAFLVAVFLAAFAVLYHFSRPDPAEQTTDDTDYLELLRQDYEKRTSAELAALDLRPRQARPELALAEFVSMVETCRGKALAPAEHRAVTACFRKLRPVEPAPAREALKGARRRLGAGLHVQLYLDTLTQTLVRLRTKGEKK